MARKPTYNELEQRVAELENEIVRLKQAEQGYKRTEGRYRTLIEESFDGIFIQKGAKIIFTNRRLNQMLGYEEGELLDLDHWLVYHPDYQQLTRERAQARMRAEKIPTHYEVKLQRKDGTWLYGEIGAYVIDMDGDPGIQVWIRDITERKRSEEALRESEKKYRTILESIEDGYFEVDVQGNFTFFNDSTCRIIGYSASELMGMNDRQYMDEQNAKKVFQVFNRVYTTGKPVKVFDWEVIRKDGIRRHVDASISLIKDTQGDGVGFRGIVRDATVRKLANDRLRESEEKYKSILSSIEEGYYEVDLSGNHTFFNDSLCRIFGYAAGELRGMNYQQLNDEEGSRRLYDIYQKVYKTGISVGAFDWEVKRKDGTPRYLEASASLMKDREGKPVGFRGIVRDITDRKQAQEMLKESDARYRSVFENAGTATVIMEEDKVISMANPEFEKLSGYSSQEVEGKMTWTEFVVPEDLERMRKYHRETREKEGKAPTEYEFRFMDREGNIKHIHNKVGTIPGTKKTVASLTDMTMRKHAEEALMTEKEKFKVLVEKSPLGVTSVGKDGRYKYINPKFIEMFGYTMEDIPTGKEWFEKAYPDPAYRSEVVSTWLEDLAKYEVGEFRPRSFNVRCKDGSEKVIDFRSVTMESGDQFVIYEDMTERKSLEAQVQHAQRMEAIGTLAGGIAHNFNNLLMGIQGYASLMLLETDPHHPFYERLKNIEKLVQSGAKLSSQLLGYARAGRYEVKPISLNEIVQETSDTFGTARKDIKIHRELAEDLFGVKADKAQIEQVLLNLYVNAADAMPGGGSLYLETRNVTDDALADKPYKVKPGNYALLTARDTGKGMDKKTMERIFEPFFTTKGLAKGTGLGLASVYGILKSHGGYIDVESEKGHGSTFYIYLPASDEPAAKDLGIEEKFLMGSETILLVDDEELILDAGAHLIEAMGYRVLKARSGPEAIEVYGRNKDAIDLVVLDVVMPEMGGGETYDRLRAVDTGIKVLLSSGYSLDGEAGEIMRRGCDGFIQKPFKVEELSKKLRKILEKK